MPIARSLGDGLHPIGPLTVANYGLNPAMELADPAQTFNARVNLCTNPSFENGTTGWSAVGTNPPTISATLARAKLGSLSCQVAYNGGNTSANNLSYVQTGLGIGVTYTFSAWIFIPTGMTGSVGCGVTGASLGTTTSTTNAWSRISYTFTATATSHTFYVFAGTYTSGQYFYVDNVLIEASASLNDYFDGTYDRLISRTNLCTNPSFENGTTGWSVGGSVLPTLGTSTTTKLFGTQSGLATWPGNSVGPYVQFSFATAVGAIYTVSAYVFVPTGQPSVLLTLAGNSSIGQTSGVTGDWVRLNYTFAATSTTSSAQIVPTTNAPGICYIDGVLIELGALGEYFDGNFPQFTGVGIAQEWTGIVNASTSIQRIPLGKTAWNGTANASSSTRWDLGLKDWTATNALVTQVAANRAHGLYAAKLMPTTVSLVPSISQTFNVLDLTNYSISVFVFIPATITGGGLTLQLTSYDITNTVVAVDFVPLLLNGGPTLGFIRLAQTYQTPVGAATLSVALRPTNQPSSLADVVYLDSFMFERADVPSPYYIDGGFSGYCWAGIPHDSTTLQTEFPDAMHFFGTAITQNFINPGSALPMGAHAILHEAPWSPVPLTD